MSNQKVFQNVVVSVFKNLENNLNNPIYKEYLDLHIGFANIENPKDLKNFEDHLISKELFKEWEEKYNITIDDLYKEARLNTFLRFEVKFKKIADAIKEMMPIDIPIDSLDDYDDIPLYLISNKYGLYGAGVILYPEIFETISSFITEGEDPNLYLIPCSVYELLVMKASNKIDIEYIKNMIRVTNETCVDERMRLSDNLYMYNKEENTITIV